MLDLPNYIEGGNARKVEKHPFYPPVKNCEDNSNCMRRLAVITFPDFPGLQPIRIPDAPINIDGI